MTLFRSSKALGLMTCVGLSACEVPEEVPVADTGEPAPLVASMPEQLFSLSELMGALRTGQDVRASIYYGECTLGGAAVVDAQGGMTVETYEWFGAGAIGNDQDYVAFSKSSLVLIYNDRCIYF